MTFHIRPEMYILFQRIILVEYEQCFELEVRYLLLKLKSSNFFFKLTVLVQVRRCHDIGGSKFDICFFLISMYCFRLKLDFNIC